MTNAIKDFYRSNGYYIHESPIVDPRLVTATREGMDKAQVGIASMWYEGNSCNMHLNQLANKVKEGVDAAGLYGMRFNTIGVAA